MKSGRNKHEKEMKLIVVEGVLFGAPKLNNRETEKSKEVNMFKFSNCLVLNLFNSFKLICLERRWEFILSHFKLSIIIWNSK